MRFWNSEAEPASQIAGRRHQHLLAHFAKGLQQRLNCLRLVNVKRIIQKSRSPGQPRAKLGPSQQLGMAGVAPRAIHGPVNPTHSEGFGTVSRQYSEKSRSARL